MPVSLSVVAAKDSAGTAIAGGLQAQDKSGAGTGPFTLGHVLIDGLAGTLMAAVTAGNALKVDGSAVTQPVSLTSTTITGTVAATQSGTWTVQPGNTANTTAWKVDGSAVTQPVSLTSTTITGTVAATQSGTWTVQPGNTPNTTAWKVDGSAVTQPVSLASVPSHAVTNAVLTSSATNIVAGSALATTSFVVGTRYLSTPPTFTNGQEGALQIDSAGRLIVNIGAGASSGAVGQGSTTSGQTGSLIQGAVTTSAPSYTTAQTSPLSLDTAGNLRVNVVAGGAGGGIVTQATGTNLHTVVDSGTITTSLNAITPVVSAALEGSHVIKASAGSLYDWHVTTTTDAGYVMIFDATSAPADGAVTPKTCRAIAADSTIIAEPNSPTTFATGITIVFSTTGPFTKTISATAFISAKAV